MHYTLHQLNVFLKVAEHQSITRASEELSLTQPAVSIQLKNFQDQFSIPLTEVVGRKLYVTDFGWEIARAAEKILNEVEAINYKTMAYQNQLAGKLTIASASTGKYVMPWFLSGFMQKHPGVDLSINVTNKTYVVRSLEKNEIDFALVSVIPEGISTERIQLLQNKLYLVGSTRLKRPDRMPKRRIFEEFPLVYREEGSATRKAMEEFIESHGFTPYKRLELQSNEAAKQAVMAGLGYSILPLIGIKSALQNESLEIIPYPGLPIVTHWHLIWLKAKNLSPVANGFLDYIKENKREIVEDVFRWYEEY